VKYILILLGIFFISPSFANNLVDLPIVCLTKKQLLDTLKGFGEKPVITGFSSRLDSKNEVELFELIIFMNPNTKSFTIVEVHGNDKFCAISAGLDFKPAPVSKNDRPDI